MDRKNVYITPKIDIINIELEGIIALSTGSANLKDAGEYHGKSNSREKTFWEDCDCF